MADNKTVDELKAMGAYKVLKGLLIQMGREQDIPPFSAFLELYEEELAENATKH